MSFSIRAQAKKAHTAAALAVGMYLTQTAQQPTHDKERRAVARVLDRLVNDCPQPEGEQQVLVEAYGHTTCGLGATGQYDRFVAMDVNIKVSLVEPEPPKV